MKTIHIIGLTAVAVLAIAFAFALGAYTASHKSRLDTLAQDVRDLTDAEAAQNKRIGTIESAVEKLQQRLGRGQGASQ